MPSLSLGLSVDRAIATAPQRIWYAQGDNNAHSANSLLLNSNPLGPVAGTNGASGVTTITFPAIGSGAAGAGVTDCFVFAPNGDLWVAYSGFAVAQTLARFSAASVAAGGTLTASTIIHLPATVAGSEPLGIAMNAAGDLWVGASVTVPSLYGYSAAQLAAGGTPTPITLTSTSWNNVQGLEYDAAGNLWVCCFGSPSITRLSASQLLATNLTIVPDVILSITAGLNACVLDPQGNLWTAHDSQNKVRKYNAANINASGTPTEAVTITGSMNEPSGMRFDRLGNLWVTQFGSGHVHQFSASDITTSGAKTPISDITYLAGVFTLRFMP